MKNRDNRPYADRLEDAVLDGVSFMLNGKSLARLVRAVVKATIPGRQSAKNAAVSMEAAVRAACRTIRRFK